MPEKIYKHIKGIKELMLAPEYVCEGCIKAGSDWVHLRTCPKPVAPLYAAMILLINT